MFYEHLIPPRLQAKFLAACVRVCMNVVCSPLGNHTTVSVSLLGWLWDHECVIASCYFPPLSVAAAHPPAHLLPATQG